jgi:hypothetical protein
METVKIEIKLNLEVKLIHYIKFLCALVEKENNHQIKTIALILKNINKRTQTLVYINQEWLAQTDELAVFNWLQNKIIQKEQYRYKYSSLFLQIEISAKAENTLLNIYKLIKMHTI